MNDQLAAYWNLSTPMSFASEQWSYQQKRKFRYDLQNYMHDTFRFELLKGKHVLEVGCGSGIDTAEMIKYGAYVTAIDFTSRPVELTRALLDELNIPNTQVLLANVTRLPFESASFDFVYSYGVLHHVPDISQALREIGRVLTPQGTLLGMVYNKDSLLYQYSIIHLHELERYNLTDAELASKYSERNVGCPYTHVYTRSKLETLLHSYFNSVKIQTRFNVIDLPNQRKVKVDLPEGHPLGWHLCFEAVK